MSLLLDFEKNKKKKRKETSTSQMNVTITSVQQVYLCFYNVPIPREKYKFQYFKGGYPSIINIFHLGDKLKIRRLKNNFPPLSPRPSLETKIVTVSHMMNHKYI